jgi:hypothetical protein
MYLLEASKTATWKVLSRKAMGLQDGAGGGA